MYNIISIVLLITGLNSIHFGVEWFRALMFASAIFAIAGTLSSISNRLYDLYFIVIKKKDQLDGSTEIKIERQDSNNQNNK